MRGEPMMNQMQQNRPMPVPMPTMPMPIANSMPAGAAQFVPSQEPMSQELYAKTALIYAAIVEMNPTYKQTVGSTIFEFVTKLVGPQFAPKITGMLIDLPI